MTIIVKDDVKRALVAVYGENRMENARTILIFEGIRWYKDKENGYIPGRVLEQFGACSGNTVSKHVKRLEDCGVIKVERSRDSYNRYELRTKEDIDVEVARQLRIAAVGAVTGGRVATRGKP